MQMKRIAVMLAAVGFAVFTTHLSHAQVDTGESGDIESGTGPEDSYVGTDGPGCCTSPGDDGKGPSTGSSELADQLNPYPGGGGNGDDDICTVSSCGDKWETKTSDAAGQRAVCKYESQQAADYACNVLRRFPTGRYFGPEEHCGAWGGLNPQWKYELINDLRDWGQRRGSPSEPIAWDYRCKELCQKAWREGGERDDATVTIDGSIPIIGGGGVPWSVPLNDSGVREGGPTKGWEERCDEEWGDTLNGALKDYAKCVRGCGEHLPPHQQRIIEERYEEHMRQFGSSMKR